MMGESLSINAQAKPKLNIKDTGHLRKVNQIEVPVMKTNLGGELPAIRSIEAKMDSYDI